MKKLLIVLTLFTVTANAQDVPTLLKQIGDQYSTVTNQLAIANKKIDSLTKPVVVVPPVVSTDYTKTYRYGLAQNAYKFGLLSPGVHTSISPAKGAAKLVYEGAKPPTLGMPYVTKDGLLFFQNQFNTYYMAYISVEPRYPNEMWYVWYKPDYFMFEKYMEEPLYGGDMGGVTAFRTLPTAYTGQVFPNAITPVNKYSIFRFKLTENPKGVANTELWIDGVKQVGTTTTYYRKQFNFGAGVNTNNSYVGWAEMFNTDVLTDEQSAKVLAELQAEYKQHNLPIATDIKYTTLVGNTTVSWKSAQPTSSYKIRWVDMSGGIEKSFYRPEYDNKLTVPSTFRGRAEVTPIGLNGEYFDIPSTKIIR